MYVYGQQFTILCDHKPLAFIASSQSVNARLMRWSLILQQYSFQVQYIKGTENNMADFLSRHTVDPSEDKGSTTTAMTLDPQVRIHLSSSSTLTSSVTSHSSGSRMLSHLRDRGCNESVQTYNRFRTNELSYQ